MAAAHFRKGQANRFGAENNVMHLDQYRGAFAILPTSLPAACLMAVPTPRVFQINGEANLSAHSSADLARDCSHPLSQRFLAHDQGEDVLGNKQIASPDLRKLIKQGRMTRRYSDRAACCWSNLGTPRARVQFAISL